MVSDQNLEFLLKKTVFCSKLVFCSNICFIALWSKLGFVICWVEFGLLPTLCFFVEIAQIFVLGIVGKKTCFLSTKFILGQNLVGFYSQISFGQRLLILSKVVHCTKFVDISESGNRIQNLRNTY